MKTAIHDTISDFLRVVEPDRYYLRFDTKDEAYPDENKTVAQELESRIKDKLNQEFHASITNVFIQYLDTEVSKRYESLYQKGCPFEIEIKSWQDQGETIKFTGDLQVVGVDRFSWSIFQSRHATLEEIKQYFLRSLKPKLKTFRSSSLAITDVDELAEIENFVNKCANQALIEQYGLMVNVRNWDRERTESERGDAKLKTKTRQARLAAKEMQIDQVLENIEEQKAQRIHKKRLRDEKQEAEISAYKILKQEELEEILTDQDQVNEKLENLEDQSEISSVDNSIAILNELSSEPQKRLKFNQALQNQNLLFPEEDNYNDNQSNDSSNSEE